MDGERKTRDVVHQPRAVWVGRRNGRSDLRKPARGCQLKPTDWLAIIGWDRILELSIEAQVNNH